MKKLLFLDLIAHKNTHSTVWLQELLRMRFEVDVWYATSRNSSDMPTSKDVQQYDVIVYCQIAPIVSRAASFNKPSVYVPMYDSETYNRGKWMRIRQQNAVVLSFTEKEGGFVRPLGIPTLAVKYFTPHCDFQPGNPRKLFLWDRGFIHFSHIKHLFSPGFLKEIVIRCTDQEAAKISGKDRKNYNVRIVPQEQYLTREAYLKMFEDCGLYVAPRMKEGIGLSFIEAMMHGKCVIGHTDATMNEYIQHMKSGILVDFHKPIKGLNLSEGDIVKMQQKCYELAEKGAVEWTLQKVAILDFIENAIMNYHPMSLTQKLKWLLLFPYHFWGDICTYFRFRIKMFV